MVQLIDIVTVENLLLTDVTHSLICEDREKVKGKGEKGLLIYFHNLLKLSISRCFA
jgi:hypothetical protein